MDKGKLYWIFQIGGWSLYGLLTIISGPIVTDDKLNAPLLALFISETLFFFVTSHLYRSVIITQKWLNDTMKSLIPKVIAATLVMGFLIYVLRVAISYILGIFNEELYQPGNIIGLTTTNALIFFLWSLFYFIYHYFERFNISLKYEAALHEIELNQLKSQLNPHFIFNALNSIRALVDEDPGKSKKAINQLANILRNSLITDKKRLTSFDNELRTVKDYLGLESIRYEERLKTEFDIHPDSNKFSVPPLMLQTLVENGIKHGISTLKEGGKIKFETKVRDSRLNVKIRNSGQFLNGRPIRGRFGISNTKQRLKLIYGDEASFRILNENNNTVLTEIEIPLNI